MKALYYDELKGHAGIKIGEFPAPDISATEVLVRVRAFSLNHVDVWVMNGNYPGAVPLPHIFASDAAGVAEKIGSAVSHVRPGDPVIVFPGLSCGRCQRCVSGHDNECQSYSLLGVLNNGVSAEYVKVPGENIFAKPDGLSFEEAASVGITFTTAWNALVLRGGLRQGDTVLVHGGGGGAGSAAIQVAKLFHATVITTVGDDGKRDRAAEIGADLVINHRTEDVAEAVKRATTGRLVDMVIDHVGAETVNTSLSCLKRGGRLMTFGATSGDEANLSLRYIFGKNIALHGIYVGPKAAVFQYLRLMPKHLRPVIDSVFDFKDAAKAYEKLLSRRFFGKIAVRV